MSMKKYKKSIKFFQSYEKILGKGITEHIKRLDNAYNKHRSKSTKGNENG